MATDDTKAPTVVAGRLEAVRVRGTDPPENIAPAGPSGERAFFSERLALFGQFACLASSGFLVMRIVLNALANRDPSRTIPYEAFPVFHLAATRAARPRERSDAAGPGRARAPAGLRAPRRSARDRPH